MVATDVASRGIGMITENPLPSPSFLFLCSPSSLLRRTYFTMRGLNSALLFKLVRSIRYTHDLVQGEYT
jgi:hypothetical protein